jgi:hypothetical protein
VARAGRVTVSRFNGFCAVVPAYLHTVEKRLTSQVPLTSAIVVLDEPGWFKQQMYVWTCDAHPWDQVNPALPKFEKYPK